MLGHVVRICVADVARRVRERLGLLHDPLRRTCGPPTRRGLGGSADQRVDDGGPDEAGLAALRWLVRGYGYEVTSVDVRAAYSHTLTAAANAGVDDGAVRTRIRTLFDDPATRGGFVASVIGKEVGLD